MSDKATLNVNGGSYDLPIIQSSEGELCIEIGKLRGLSNGVTTFDRGFKNTASCESKITYLDGEKGILRYRGYSIEELASKASFLEVAYLLIFGELPNKEELEDMKKIDLSAVAFKVSDKVVAQEFVDSRQIPKERQEELWFVPIAQSLNLLSHKYRDRVLGNDPRVILPFEDENGELVGITGRAINDSPLRYLTMRFLDDVPLIYNIKNVDKTKTIYVTEGPIDSLFLPNSIAVGGSDFKKIDDSLKENAIIIYDNEPRNTEIIKKINEVIDLGYNVCIWNEKKVSEFKDINDMIMGGLSQEEIVEIINSNTYNGLSAKTKLQEYKKI